MVSKKTPFLVTLVLLITGIGLATAYASPATPKQFARQNASVTGGSPVGSTFTVSRQELEEKNPAIAYNPDRQEYLAVWHNDRAGNDDIQAQRLSKDGTPVEGAFWISAGAGADRRYPDVTYNSTAQEYMVVWEHEESGKYNIHARIVYGYGGLMGSSDIVIASQDTDYKHYAPKVAASSTENKFLVVWQAEQAAKFAKHVVGQLVTWDGALDNTHFDISDAPNGHARSNIDLAYNRTRNEFLVAWQQNDSGNDDVYAQRVKVHNGSGLLGSAIAVSDDANAETNPSVAALPNVGVKGRYLVVFEYDTGSAQGLRGQAVESDGSLGTLVTFPYAASSGPQHNPAVAASENAQRFLVTWRQENYAPPAVNDGIVGRAVSGEMVLLGDSITNGSFVLGGFSADNPAVAAGDVGDFMTLFDDTELASSNSNIYGQLWGNRIYLPFVLKN
jgi:hypothetical protein